MLRLYNTLTRKKEAFAPATGHVVGFYSCGPTVYNYAHIGNLRTYLFEDFLKRSLLHEGWEVNHIMNITDVGHLTSDADEGDDKMEKGAKREKKTVWDIAAMYTKAFQKNLQDLNVLPPSKWVKATDHIADQLQLIQRLEQKGLTYKTSDGIYYDTSKFPSYAKLARLNLNAQKEGTRLEVNKEKRNPSDFALWKFSRPDEHRQMEWESPWGVGFPGWHIECSAMSMKYLGQTFDIHAGGIDHIPVHHTNEIAQSEGATGKPLARFWIHGEFLVLKGDAKMAKSAENFLTLDALIAKGYDPLAYRYLTLTAHYRTKLTFSWEALDSAASSLTKLRGLCAMLDAQGKSSEEFLTRFWQCLDDDLNAPKALAVMWELFKSNLPSGDKRATLEAMDEFLGLGLAKIKKLNIPASVQTLITERQSAREKKDYAKSDALREQILDKGFLIDDTPEGFVVKRR